jgi:predicted nucleic acid-binding protein
MIRVVLDTNVVVLANLARDGLPASVLDLGAG